jgi:hypothetical protein
VVEYLAAQLGVADVSVVKRYAERLPTQHEHARELRQAYGYRDLSDPGAMAGLREFMEGLCRMATLRPAACGRWLSLAPCFRAQVDGTGARRGCALEPVSGYR